MGNITGRDGLPVDHPDGRRARVRAERWVAATGLATSRSRRPGSRSSSIAAIFIPMARSGALRGRGLLVGGGFYLVYLRSWLVAGRRGHRRPRLTGGPGPACYTPATRQTSTVARPAPPAQEPSRMLTEKPTDAAPRPAATTPPSARRRSTTSIAYFEGDFVPMRDAKVSIMTHAFMYGTATFEGIRGYWNADAGQALRAEAPRARRAHPPVVPDPAHGRRPVGRRADRPHRRDGPPQRLPRGRLHPAVVLQVDRGDRRPAPRPRATSCTSSRCRSGTTSTPTTASGS